MEGDPDYCYFIQITTGFNVEKRRQWHLKKHITKESYHILSYSCYFLYSPTTYAENDVEGKGKLDKSLIPFLFSSFSLISKSKAEYW